MKKVLLIVLGLIFMSAPAEAVTTIVHHNIAGVPTHITVGNGPRMSANPYRFGSNALFTPENARLAGERMRARRMQRALINSGAMGSGMQNPRTVNMTMTPPPAPPISRFDRNYRIPQRRSYVRNGIICYE